ncbi:uncharacterized protein WM294_016690 [Sarcoramphus papa]
MWCCSVSHYTAQQGLAWLPKKVKGGSTGRAKQKVFQRERKSELAHCRDSADLRARIRLQCCEMLTGQFGVQEDELLKCLICTMSVTRGEQIQRFHTQQQAEDNKIHISHHAVGHVGLVVFFLDVSKFSTSCIVLLPTVFKDFAAVGWEEQNHSVFQICRGESKSLDILKSGWTFLEIKFSILDGLTSALVCHICSCRKIVTIWNERALYARDSIAKVAYGRVFGWIVCKINELLAENVDPEVELTEIGILDIFGFENFAVNRFEQLCINLANEQLQHFFNHHIFQLEQAAYKEEELPWETITFNNNEPILNLLLAKPLGLLSLLDEQSAFPQATDKTFVDKLISSFKGNLHFQPGRGHVLGFSIIHYAGKVQYTAGGFLEKNRDTLPANIRGLFINSITPLLSVLFTATVSRTGTLMPHVKAKVIPAADDKFNSTRKQSAGAQFRHSLMVLMERMYSANPHFVRCIKPNSQKKPGVVDSQVVLQQLRYNGLLETIRIRRDGFSWRPSFEEFAERYGILLIKPDVSLTKESCLEILQSTELTGWICGKSRLFFKYWHQEQLAKYVERLERAAVVIQKVFRGFRYRKRYLKLVADLRAQAQRLQEEAERERSQQLAVEAEAQKRISLPVPMPRKRHPQPCPHPRDKPPQPPVPRPRSKLTESTPFDNFLDPSAPRPVLGTEEQTGEEAKRRKVKRGATLRWFKETQAQKVMQDDGAFPSWLHGMISRREAENLLIDKPLGCFLVRISQSRPGYTLTYRGKGRCRHYMIQMQPNASYVILGEDRAHASLTELVRYHQTVGIQPFMEILTVPCGQKSSESLDYEDLECLTLGPPAAKGETPPEEQSCPSRPSTSRCALQSGAATILRRVCFRRTNNWQNQQSLDKSKTKPSSGKERGSQRAFPRLYSSIRLAMQEIQQFSSTPLNTFVESCCQAVSIKDIEPK